MANEIMIPILPCRSIDDMLTFYRALGFEVTYQQERPNNYGCVQRGDINLHFFTLKDYDPKQSYSTCLVLVPDANELRQAFVEGLRTHYGKLPAAGIPRVTPLRKKQEGGLGFNVIDPGGNWIRISQIHTANETDEQAEPKKQTRLGKAISTAELLADSKGDYAAAAKLLDKALDNDDPAPAVERVQALVARAALALMMDERERAEVCLTLVRQIDLSEDERATLASELERASDLAQQLSK